MIIRQFVFGALLCVCTLASAQEGQSHPVVKLEDVRRAAANNLDVSLARRALSAARGDILAADHAPAPQLTAKSSQMDLQHGFGAGNVFSDKRIDKSLGIDWTIERGEKRDLRTRTARANAEGARADLQEAVIQQQIAASNAFYDLLAAQDKLGQIRSIAGSSDELLETAQKRVRAGDLSKQEAARVEIEAARARADVRSAEADRLRAALALAQVTGLPMTLVAADEWPGLAPVPGNRPEIELRADVGAARERVTAAQRALDAAVALRKADFTVGASYDHFPGTSTRLVELRIQVPLAGEVGYAYQGEIARARAQLEQAEDQLEKTRRLAAVEMGRLEEDLRASSTRAVSYGETIVPRARQVAEMAEYAYSHGASSLTELIDARRTLRAVLVEEIAARADHARALSVWQLRQREPTDAESP